MSSERHLWLPYCCDNEAVPRLTHDDYLTRRRHLLTDQKRSSPTSGTLTKEQHRVLTDFYGLALELDDKEAIAYRRAITKRKPALVQEAGMAYRTFAAAALELAAQPAAVRVRGRRRRGQLVVRAVRRDPPDMQMLVSALLMHTRDQDLRRRSRPARRSDGRPSAGSDHPDEPESTTDQAI